MHLILKTVLENTKAKSVFAWIFVVLWQFPFSLVPLFTLKALTRIDIEWQKYWVPTASIAPASHLERASERIEARIKWLYKALVSTDNLLSVALQVNDYSCFDRHFQP